MMETAEDSFETFFNSESLSDRVLVITEVAKVYPVSTPNSVRSKRRYYCIEASPEYVGCSKRNNIETVITTPTDELPQKVPHEVVEDEGQAEDAVDDDEDDDERKDLNEEMHEVPEAMFSDVQIVKETKKLIDNQRDAGQPEDDGDELPPLVAENFQCPPIKTDENFSEVQTSAVSHVQEENPVIVPKIEFEVGELPTCVGGNSLIPSTSNDCLPDVSICGVVAPSTRRSTPVGVSPTLIDDQNLASPESQLLKETKVYVHSVILAAKSQFFKCLFATSGMRETKEKEVKIEIAQGQTKSMLILLRCFYNKNFINAHNLQTVLDVCSLAMQYCYDGLIEKCLDIFRCRAENVTEVHDINQIAHMVSKIQCELQQHKEKCTRVMKTCGPFLVNSFYPIDELLEKAPEKFYQLHLNSMYLLLDPNVQERFNQEHGNLFIYAMQKWLKAHLPRIVNDVTFKRDVITFIEKLLNVVELRYITGAFLTNVMTYEHSPLALWDGYKDWYIRALQTFIYEYNSNKRTDGRTEQRYSIIKRRRFSKFVRQEKNADIFSLTCPIVLNGFEIGIYLRVREDRKIHVICKCKNLTVNKTGFDHCELQFKLKGTIKLNVDQNLWCEQFPAAHSHWVNDWFGFSYKQNTMCLQMYSICKLAPTVYELAKKFGFCLAVQMQQIK